MTQMQIAGLVWALAGGAVCLLVLLVLAFVGIYNSLVIARNRCDSAWAQIDVQLRRRYDLIPNLVETVKGYAAHERETLERVVAARNAGIAARTVEEQAQAENMITAALRQLFALSERYPDLKANQNFQQLQAELQNTEEQIAQARDFYTDVAMDYNNRIQVFPNSIVAGLCHFAPRPYFEIEQPEARRPVEVDFSRERQ